MGCGGPPACGGAPGPAGSATVDRRAGGGRGVTTLPPALHTVSVPSPCISVCRMDDAVPPLCQGCFRTLLEIAGWSRMHDGDKRRVWARIAQRTEETTTP
ncbi:MAG: DUF1289 domain-containing protein [Variovorax sp.]|nr:MAG: DUF1289 domain-containing protein [Variovorax sp.]